MSLELKIGMFGNPSSEYFVSEELLNELLIPPSKGDEDCWHFETEGLKELISSIRRLFVVSNGGFTFQALTNGEAPQETESLPIDDFIELLSQNKINKFSKYIVIGTV